jgi:predicted DNA-binding antitoxin AbrB/MazE fold protein
MTVAVEAIYENGVLRPEKPLGFKEHARVRVIIEDEAAVQATEDDDPTGWKTARRFIGLWKDAPAGEPIAAEHDQHLYK